MGFGYRASAKSNRAESRSPKAGKFAPENLPESRHSCNGVPGVQVLKRADEDPQ
jgi:hypothetical protein